MTEKKFLYLRLQIIDARWHLLFQLTPGEPQCLELRSLDRADAVREASDLLGIDDGLVNVGISAAPDIDPVPDIADLATNPGDPLDDSDAAKLDRIGQQEAKVCLIEARWEEAKLRAKMWSKEFEAESLVLRAVIRECRTPPEPNLFATGSATAESPLVAREPEDDTWRDVPIADLELKPAIRTAILSAGITDLGKLADWTKPYIGCTDRANNLTDIKGIGLSAAEAINAATEKFWTDRNRQQRGE